MESIDLGAIAVEEFGNEDMALEAVRNTDGSGHLNHVVAIEFTNWVRALTLVPLFQWISCAIIDNEGNLFEHYWNSLCHSKRSHTLSSNESLRHSSLRAVGAAEI